jgi:hypothetical protein
VPYIRPMNKIVKTFDARVGALAEATGLVG